MRRAVSPASTTTKGRIVHIGRPLARLVIGSLFIGHGAQKLFGSFGGPGLEGTRGMMESLELRPAHRNAVAAGAAETGGGALLVLGLGTPLACAALIGTMITAIRKVHLPNGPWAANGGYEYNVALVAVLVAIAEDGPGGASLDRLLGTERHGWRWGLFALVAGAVASTLTIEVGRRGGTATGSPAAPAEPTTPPFGDTAGDPVTDGGDLGGVH
jgi:putative oxidoreductase